MLLQHLSFTGATAEIQRRDHWSAGPGVANIWYQEIVMGSRGSIHDAETQFRLGYNNNNGLIPPRSLGDMVVSAVGSYCKYVYVRVLAHVCLCILLSRAGWRLARHALHVIHCTTYIARHTLHIVHGRTYIVWSGRDDIHCM